MLILLAARETDPVSGLAVKLLPGDDLGKTRRRRQGNIQTQELKAEYATVVVDESGSDPLGVDLGSRSILRTSLLTPVPPIC